MAWDNYDVQVETLDGKDTLHVTVGIAFQNYIAKLHQRKDSVDTKNIGCETRLKYDKEIKEILPFSMNLKLAKFKFQNISMHTEATISSRPLDFV